MFATLACAKQGWMSHSHCDGCPWPGRSFSGVPATFPAPRHL